ncbi:MAG: hypothetical protein QNJ29_15030, partial [Rhizobiaceae bacterium]|nr:hypothetical protein [Rhizobiaceae bacterium]
LKPAIAAYCSQLRVSVFVSQFDKLGYAGQTERMTRILVVFFAMLFAGSALAGEGCTCKYKDYDVPEGQTICMNTPSGSKMATCSRVLNNTSWKFLSEACPQAQNTIDQSPKNLDRAEILEIVTPRKG